MAETVCSADESWRPSVFQVAFQASARKDQYLASLQHSMIPLWYQREGYVQAMADLVGKELDTFKETNEICVLVIDYLRTSNLCSSPSTLLPSGCRHCGTVSCWDIMMDMRQHSGGAMPSNSLQYSPQSALSNENLFLLDPNFSSSPSMDMCGLNPSFSSQMNSDFSSVFMDSAFPNSLGFNMGSSMESSQGQGQSMNGFYAADEWSGTTNSSCGASNAQQNQQPQQQQHMSALLNQRQSMHTQSSVDQSTSLDVKSKLNSFENSLSATSQVDHGVLGAVNKGSNEGGDTVSRHSRLQGMVKQLSALAQGPMGAAHQLQGNNQQGQQPDVRETGGFYGAEQQSHSESLPSPNVRVISSHEESLQDNQFMQMQALEFRNHQAGLGNGSLRSGFQIMHGQQGSSQNLVYNVRGGDVSAANYQGLQSETLFQSGRGENSAGLITAGSQLGQEQSEQNLQAVRNLALQLQGKLSQSALQNQLSNKYMSLSGQTANVSAQQLAFHAQQSQGSSDQLSSLQSHSNNHPLSMLLQSQASAQFQSLSQAQVQAQAQAHQAQAQAQAANQQAAFHARQLQNGSQQPLLTHNSFQSIQSGANQALSGGNRGLHLNGTQQMMAQLQPRLLNPTFQGLKAGGPQVLQPSSPAASLSSANSNESNAKTPMPGTIAARCIQVLLRYIQEQRKRPPANDILFWKSLVNEFFVPGATKRWCLSSYNSMPMGRHAQNLFPMDYWFCNLCGVHPGRGFESSTDVLPRLFKIKYASGLEDELLFLDIAEGRYMLPNGRLVLEFPRAVHESKFPELRVVRYGRLRVTFSSSFKICSWEFCTKMHEEVVPRKDLLLQAQQLAKLVKDCEQEGFEKSATNFKAYCNEFTATARQLASKLEAPSVNDLGFSKRYVRCLQIAEVVNSMKDLISFERRTCSGPIASLANFPSVRKVPEDLLACSTSSQIVNQLSQANNSDVSGAHSSSQQADPQSDGMKAQLQAQVIHHLQPQSANNQLLAAQPSSRSMSALQGSSFGHGQSHMSSQVMSNFGQLAQQIYESAGNRQLLQQQPLNQPITHTQLLNHTGQQSLPGTPQSEMSDMRTNT
ncbi:hypothetical protein GOP47_0009289 [Adiantum capillus-veneris]|uniref:Uncharacterized protein n=1 Tax=Adiantum capillus-veneris TaxID=13818 RepID=A0A9D4UX89_ADICA|nr:hypothetical protein GOP47_0009289 [Adiantum capillus-veneris]